MTEQLAFHQGLGQGGAVDGDIGTAATAAKGRGWCARPIPCRCRSHPRSRPTRWSARLALLSAITRRIASDCPTIGPSSPASIRRRRKSWFSLLTLICVRRLLSRTCEMMRIDRLAQVVVGAKFYRLDGVFDFALARDHDGGELPAVRPNFCEHRQAVLLGQSEVEQQNLRVTAFNQLQSALAVLRALDPISPGRNQKGPRLAHVSVVFDDKYSGASFHSARCVRVI